MRYFIPLSAWFVLLAACAHETAMQKSYHSCVNSVTGDSRLSGGDRAYLLKSCEALYNLRTVK